jgi:uncharacterized protein (TIGR02145 family)
MNKISVNSRLLVLTLSLFIIPSCIKDTSSTATDEEGRYKIELKDNFIISKVRSYDANKFLIYNELYNYSDKYVKVIKTDLKDNVISISTYFLNRLGVADSSIDSAFNNTDFTGKRKIRYQYNNENYLISRDDSPVSPIHYEYANGNRIKSVWGTNKTYYTYNSLTNYIDIESFTGSYLGKLNKNLRQSSRLEFLMASNSESTTYEYTLNSAGLVIQQAGTTTDYSGKFLRKHVTFFEYLYDNDLPIELPVLCTRTASNISTIEASSGGIVSEDGGAPVLSRGICWSTTSNPTTLNSKTLNGSGVGSFISILTDLKFNTKYFVRSYATNSMGTAYGNELTFTTSDGPTLITAPVTLITRATAISGGNIIADNGKPVSTRGVCWNTGKNPTIDNNRTTDGAGTGSFISYITGLNPGTIYYVRSYSISSSAISYGNEISFKTSPSEPILGITTVSSTGPKTAVISGNVISDGGGKITSCGICWSTLQNPSISDNTTTNGTATGVFESVLTGLTGNTTYYARAYASNSSGTGYSNQVVFITLEDQTGLTGTVTDIEGNKYPTIGIGSQIWMAANMKTTRFRNGDAILTTTPATRDISGESSPKYQWAYDGNENNAETYGRLYTWYAATDTRNLCPTGWHLPSDAEWAVLADFLSYSGYGYQGSGSDIAKSLASTSGWEAYSTAGTIGNDQNTNNNSGFSGLPGGSRTASSFNDIHELFILWTASVAISVDGFARYIVLDYHSANIGKASAIKWNGCSVRCIRDN